MTMLYAAATLQRASSINRWRATFRCLEFVNWAYGEPTSRMGDLGPLPGGAPNGAWEDAKQGWYGSAFKHPGDGTDAPAGVPVYWETGPSGNTAGHIVISDGDGWCYTTDYAGAGSVSRQRIAYINSLRGTALGWTDDFGNNPIDVRQISIPDAQAIAEQEQQEEEPNMIIRKSAESGKVAVVGELTGRIFPGADFSFEANKFGWSIGDIREVPTDNVLATLVNEANARGEAFARTMARTKS